MDEYRDISAKVGADNIADILSSDNEFGSRYKDNCNVKIYGIISKIEKRTTKSNSTMCFLTIEDISASIECIVFARQYAEKMQYLQAGTIVLIRGRLSLREDKEATIVCESIEPNPVNVLKDEVKPQKKQRKGIFLRLASRDCDEIIKIKTLVDIFGGSFPVYVYYTNEEKYEVIGYVNMNNPMVKELKYHLGDENVVVRC